MPNTTLSRIKPKQRTPAASPAAPSAPTRTFNGPLFGALLFLSGATSLIYQILWIKQLALIVGVDVYAVTTGVSAFFAGLALGGWFLGRRADRTAHPLRLYAALEAGIALLGITATLALAHMPEPFVVLEKHIGPFAWLLPFATVALPALLMGGTLPALMAALTPHSEKLARSGGLLYAANTLGAAVGALLTTFLLIRTLGVQGAAFTAVALNAILALTAHTLSRRTRQPVVAQASSLPTAHSAAPIQNPKSKIQNYLPLILYSIAGAIALGYEIVWSQSVAIFTSTRAFAFTIVLATYLIGLVLGSALYARYADRVRNPWGIFGALIALAGLTALLFTTTAGGWLLLAQYELVEKLRAAAFSETTIMSARFALAALCTIFVPTLLLGAAFPAALRLCANASHAARDTGRILALNTLGGIAGTFIAGFVLVPALGLVRTLSSLALAASAIALITLFGRARSPSAPRTPIATTIILLSTAATLILAVITPSDNFARLQTTARGGKLISYEESPGGIVSVVEQGKGANTFRRLYIQGVSNSGDGMASLRYMRLQALLPLIIYNPSAEPRSALCIALGTGITAGALTQYPSLETRVTAELLPAVVRAAPLFKGNYNIANIPSASTTNSLTDIRIRDGRRELLRNPQRYDLITLEPPPPSAAGVVNLYSRDFYELARTRLNPHGLFAQWLPIATQNDTDTRSLVRAFLDAFPHVTLWTTELHEMLLVGSTTPQTLDAREITSRFNQPTVTRALSEIGIATPAALLATYICDERALARYVADAPPVTDNRPLIEYASWVTPGEIQRALPRLLALQSTDTPPLTNATPAFLDEIHARRATLHDFYRATLAAYARNRDAWQTYFTRVMTAEPANPYYRGNAAEN